MKLFIMVKYIICNNICFDEYIDIMHEYHNITNISKYTSEYKSMCICLDSLFTYLQICFAIWQYLNRFCVLETNL